MKCQLFVLLVASIVCAEVFAQEDDVQQLRQQLELLKEQVATLERSVARLEGGAPADSSDARAAAEPDKPGMTADLAKPESRLALKADFRYRHDWIDLETQDGFVERRDRSRLRARAELSAKITDRARIGFGVASGDEDPISTNQTLGQQASTKDWRLDLAYFEWNLMDNLHWWGGKYKNPDHRVGDYGLLWDSDLRPEGMSLVYDSGTLFATFGFNFIDSDTRGPLGDRYGYRNFQLGYRFSFGSESELMLGASYFDFDTEGRPTLLPALAFNNTVDANGRLAYDYDEKEFFVEYKTMLAGRRLSAFVDYVENIEIDEQNKGYAYGFRYGGLAEAGDWEIGYTYQKLEADAVFGAFTDSDFAGGGTDNQGYSMTFAYALNPKINLQLTYFDTERALHRLDEELSFDRAFLDLIFKH